MNEIISELNDLLLVCICFFKRFQEMLYIKANFMHMVIVSFKLFSKRYEEKSKRRLAAPKIPGVLQMF